eukprot:2557943-Rhodomonas_salina.1
MKWCDMRWTGAALRLGVLGRVARSKGCCLGASFAVLRTEQGAQTQSFRGSQEDRDRVMSRPWYRRHLDAKSHTCSLEAKSQPRDAARA